MMESCSLGNKGEFLVKKLESISYAQYGDYKHTFIIEGTNEKSRTASLILMCAHRAAAADRLRRVERRLA